MMKTIRPILAGTGLLVVALALACGTRSPNGVMLTGKQIPRAAQEAIERGLQKSFDVGRCKDWYGGMSLEDYTVDVKDGVITPGGVTAYKTSCGAYCGSIWDQGGWIYVGGQANAPTNTLILPYIPGREADLQLAAQYEVEHCLAYQNDKTLYNATAVHALGQGHPILHCK